VKKAGLGRKAFRFSIYEGFPKEVLGVGGGKRTIPMVWRCRGRRRKKLIIVEVGTAGEDSYRSDFSERKKGGVRLEETEIRYGLGASRGI